MNLSPLSLARFASMFFVCAEADPLNHRILWTVATFRFAQIAIDGVALPFTGTESSQLAFSVFGKRRNQQTALLIVEVNRGVRMRNCLDIQSHG